MNWQNVSFDWMQARAFLVTAEEGSFSAAARALGLSQPTLGRQVAALEQALGVTMFERSGRTVELTGAGREMLEHVRAMGDAAARMALTASGQAQSVSGKVSITASDTMSALWLPPVLAQLQRDAPGLRIEVVTSNQIQDLTRRDADIAIRHVRPDQPDLITKLVKETNGYLVAAHSYTERAGVPRRLEDLKTHDFVGFEPLEMMLEVLNGMGCELSPSNVAVSSNNGMSIWHMIRAGLGVGLMTEDILARSPEVARVVPEFAPIAVPVWLTTHRELHTSRRIRVVFDALTDALRAS